MAQPRKSASRDVTSRAAGVVERGAAALMGIQVARMLHTRWRRMSASSRGPVERLAQEVKDRALDLRGEPDPMAAGLELSQANERFAEAIVESAEADPEVSEIEVRDLRAELTRELDRLSGADVRASRGPGSDPAAGRARTDERG